MSDNLCQILLISHIRKQRFFNDTKELIYETETNAKISKLNNLGLPNAKLWGERKDKLGGWD